MPGVAANFNRAVEWSVDIRKFQDKSEITGNRKNAFERELNGNGRPSAIGTRIDGFQGDRLCIYSILPQQKEKKNVSEIY